tara:strand:- start:1556 stop:2434 length:879 start_codon:yes stop_codon:yes gene_type:complete
MKVLNLSGGAFKASGHVGVCEVLLKNGYKPDIITGVSAGAVLAVPMALGLWGKMIRFSTHLKLKQIFSKAPILENGKISKTSYWRFIRRKESLGVMGNLARTISEVVTPSNFKEYKNTKYPIVYIMAVDSATGKRYFFNVKELSYNDYIKLTVASASVPLANEKVRYNGLYLTDGGIRNGIISHWLFEKYKSEIKESISIYTRPQELTNLLDQNWKPEQVEESAMRDLQIMMLQISIADEKREKALAELYKIKSTQLFLPKVLEHSFDTNPIALRNLYLEGKNIALKHLLNG